MPDAAAGIAREDEREVGFVIADVARLMRTVFERRVRRLGLTRPQWLVLNRLHRYPGITQVELAEMLEVEKATAGRIIDRMERNGWVERHADAADRRVNRLHLTASAARIEAQLQEAGTALVDDSLALLSGAERRQLGDLIGRMKRRLQAMSDPAAEPAAGSGPARRRRGGA